MTLAHKLRSLRTAEGRLRGFEREMTQKEVVEAMQQELREAVSQPYLSQIESGRRRHLTSASRQLLAAFFKVHPGYLVDDPEGYHVELTAGLRCNEERLDEWLLRGASQFRKDPGLVDALMTIAGQADSRRAILLLSKVLETPELFDRLAEALDWAEEDPAALAKETNS